MDNFTFAAAHANIGIVPPLAAGATVSAAEKIDRDYLIRNLDALIAENEEYKKEKRRKIMEHQKNANDYNLNKIKDICFKKDRCTVVWSDGSTTRVTWDHCEPWDSEKAILYALVTKWMGKTPVRKILSKYAPRGKKTFIDSVM